MTKAASSPDAARDERNVVSWTAGALLLTLWIGIPGAGSAAAAAPLAVHMRRAAGEIRAPFLVRWLVVVFVIGVAMAGLGDVRSVRAVASGGWTLGAARAWLDGNGDPFPPLPVLATQVAVFVAAAAATRGLAGVLVLSEIVLGAAVAASAVYGRAFNALSVTIAVAPPWTIAAIVGCCVLLSPLRSWRMVRPIESTSGANPDRADSGGARMHGQMLFGASLIALALLLRLVTAGAFTRLVHRLTVP
jgi:hypothetical protein